MYAVFDYFNKERVKWNSISPVHELAKSENNIIDTSSTKTNSSKTILKNILRASLLLAKTKIFSFRKELVNDPPSKKLRNDPPSSKKFPSKLSSKEQPSDASPYNSFKSGDDNRIHCKNISSNLLEILGIDDENKSNDFSKESMTDDIKRLQGYSNKWERPTEHGFKNSSRIIPIYYLTGKNLKGKIFDFDYYEMIKDDIKNLRVLSIHQLEYINTLDDPKKIEIINLFNDSLSMINCAYASGVITPVRDVRTKYDSSDNLLKSIDCLQED